jgi:hypothetical protein
VTEVIISKRIIGHVAALLNPASTFGFLEQTISAVGMGMIVSLFIYINNHVLLLKWCISLSTIIRGGRGWPDEDIGLFGCSSPIHSYI